MSRTPKQTAFEDSSYQSDAALTNNEPFVISDAAVQAPDAGKSVTNRSGPEAGVLDSAILSPVRADASVHSVPPNDNGKPKTTKTPTCDDDQQNGDETDLDCGGKGACPRCADGEKCTENSDCQGAVCVSGQCCTSGPDSDGDGVDDCTELADGDSWTDPFVFNGVHVIFKTSCPYADLGITCPMVNTLQVENCMATGLVIEEKDQYSGWDWSTSSTNICNSDYKFAPNWTHCGTDWQVQWKGYIKLSNAGQHCFRIIGDGCQTFIFNNTMQAVFTNKSTTCFNVEAGVYPVMWHYTTGTTSSGTEMQLQYCYGGSEKCAPSTALPASLLRPTCP